MSNTERRLVSLQAATVLTPQSDMHGRGGAGSGRQDARREPSCAGTRGGSSVRRGSLRVQNGPWVWWPGVT